MDFSDLHVFTVVARLGSFSRAASQLNLAQSALSRRVQRLEYQFGTKLLDRHSRGALPTEAGLMLVHKVGQLERELQQLQYDILSLKKHVCGEITIAMPHGIVQFLASRIVERFKERCPDVRLRIHEGRSVNNQEDVADGVADVAIAYNPIPKPEMIIHPLLFEGLLLVGSTDPAKDIASIRHLDSFPASELPSLPLLLPSKPHNLRVAVETAIHRSGGILTLALEVNGLSALKTLVKSGIGYYTVLTYAPLHPDISSNSLSAIPVVDPSIEFPVGLIYRTNRREFRPLIELIAVVEDIILQLGSSRFWRPAQTSAPNILANDIGREHVLPFVFNSK